MVRAILKECLGLESQPLYGDGDARAFATPELKRLVGHVESGLRNEELLAHARASESPVIVKTHEPPLDDSPTIHIVRNGQSALVSYHHFMREVEGLPLTMEEIIRGEVYGGSWSDHYKTWAPRPHSLLLRYERVAAEPDLAAVEMARFLAVPVVGRCTTSFSTMQQMLPKFFRQGSDEANLEEMRPFRPLFDQYHAETMRDLGYY